MGCGDGPYLASLQLDAPTQVNLFHVGEELLVEPSSLDIGRVEHHECGTACPEHLLRGVILAVVGLHGVEYASAAVGISVGVDESAGGSGILKSLRLCGRKYLWLRSSGVGIGFHEAVERGEPVVVDAHVGVEQDGVFIRVGHTLYGEVVALGETVVLTQLHDFHRRELAAQQLHGAVGRAVVGHYHVGQKSRGMLHHRG